MNGNRIVVIGGENWKHEDEALREQLGSVVVIDHADSPPRGDDIAGIVAFPRSPIGERELRGLPSLRFVATPSVGTDHIDLGAAQRAGIPVLNAPGYNTGEVAEHTLAFILMLLRDIPANHERVRAGLWLSPTTTARRVAGARLGLVGFGQVAHAVAERALPLGMTVSTFTRSPVIGDTDVHAFASLDELLADSDIVSLHIPLNAGTRGILSRERLFAMKQGSLLVNTSRGPLLDQEGLLEALDSGPIAGAALDVLDTEPGRVDDPLRTHPRVVVTPHMAWFSPTAGPEAFRIIGAQAARILGVHRPADAG